MRNLIFALRCRATRPETERPMTSGGQEYRIHLFGGPCDGERVRIRKFPDIVQLRHPRQRGVNLFYVPTGQTTSDGAHVFAFEHSAAARNEPAKPALHAVPQPAGDEASAAQQYRILLSGGPYDGEVSELNVLPDIAGMKPVTGDDRGPVYAKSRTGAVTEDGAYIFDYVPPTWWERLLRRR